MLRSTFEAGKLVVWEQEDGSPLNTLPPFSCDCVVGGSLSTPSPTSHQGREENHTKNAIDHGGLLKVYLPSLLSPSSSWTQGIPQIGIPLPHIVISKPYKDLSLSLVFVSLRTALCNFICLVSGGFIWLLIGDHWPLVKLREVKLPKHYL